MAEIRNFVARKDKIVALCEKILNCDSFIAETLIDGFGAFSDRTWKLVDPTKQLGCVDGLAQFLRNAEKESDLSGPAWSRGLLTGARRSPPMRAGQFIEETIAFTDLTPEIIHQWLGDETLGIHDLDVSEEKLTEKYALLVGFEAFAESAEELREEIKEFIWLYDVYAAMTAEEKAAAKEAEIAALKSQFGRAIAGKKKLRGARGVA